MCSSCTIQWRVIVWNSSKRDHIPTTFLNVLYILIIIFHVSKNCIMLKHTKMRKLYFSLKKCRLFLTWLANLHKLKGKEATTSNPSGLPLFVDVFFCPSSLFSLCSPFTMRVRPIPQCRNSVWHSSFNNSRAFITAFTIGSWKIADRLRTKQ